MAQKITVKITQSKHCTRTSCQPQPRPWTVPRHCTGSFQGLRGAGHPRTNWRSTVNKDLLRMVITWEEAEVAAHNRSEWCRSVA